MAPSENAAALPATFSVNAGSAPLAGQQPSSRRRKIVTGALVGFGVGALLGVTVGQEMCLDSSKWQCVGLGGSMGAFFGIMIAKR